MGACGCCCRQQQRAAGRHLTLREIKLIYSSWMEVREIKDFGVIIFEDFFAMFPEEGEKFGEASGFDALRSERMWVHATKLIVQLDEIITLLCDGDYDEFIFAIKSQGFLHYSRNIKAEDLTKLCTSLSATLDRALGHKYDEQTRDAWENFFKLLIKYFGEGYEDGKTGAAFENANRYTARALGTVDHDTQPLIPPDSVYWQRVRE